MGMLGASRSNCDTCIGASTIINEQFLLFLSYFCSLFYFNCFVNYVMLVDYCLSFLVLPWLMSNSMING